MSYLSYRPYLKLVKKVTPVNTPYNEDLIFRIRTGTGFERVFNISSDYGDWKTFIKSLDTYSIISFNYNSSSEPFSVVTRDWYQTQLEDFLFGLGYSRIYLNIDPTDDELEARRNPIQPRETNPIRTYRITRTSTVGSQWFYSTLPLGAAEIIVSPNYETKEWFSIVKSVDVSAELYPVTEKKYLYTPVYYTLTIREENLDFVKALLDEHGYTRIFLDYDPSDEELNPGKQVLTLSSRSPSPVRSRSPSPVRNRSPSPVRNRSPSPNFYSDEPSSPIRSKAPSPEPQVTRSRMRSVSPDFFSLGEIRRSGQVSSPLPPLLPQFTSPVKTVYTYNPIRERIINTQTNVNPSANLTPQILPQTLFEHSVDTNQQNAFIIKIGRQTKKLQINSYSDTDPKFTTIVNDFITKCFKSSNIGFASNSTLYAVYDYYKPVATAMFTTDMEFANLNLTQIDSVQNLIPVKWFTTAWFFLYNVCTDKHFRGHHLQEKLLNFAFDDLKSKFGSPIVVYLFVYTDNDSAIALYNRMGFINLRTVQFYERPAFLMYLEIVS